MMLGLFELTVYLSEDDFELEVFAGNDRDQVQSPTDRFRIVQATRSDIVREILLKLERALARDEKGIDVNVQGTREIIRDPAFPLPTTTGAAVSGAVRATSSAVRPKLSGTGQTKAVKAKAAKHAGAEAKTKGAVAKTKAKPKRAEVKPTTTEANPVKTKKSKAKTGRKR
jgi:hypothetical protein